MHLTESAKSAAPNTRVQAKAAALFGASILKPGVHQLPPDREGWCWMLVVNSAGRIICLSAVPLDLLDAPTLERLHRWQDIHSTGSPLALVR